MAQGLPGELLADFQQYYGLDVRDVRGIGVSRAATLLVHLPAESRVRAAMTDDRRRVMAAWTPEVRLLAMIQNELAVLLWSRTKDAQHGRNKPEPILPPEARKVERGMSVPRSEYKARLDAMHARARS